MPCWSYSSHFCMFLQFEVEKWKLQPSCQVYLYSSQLHQPLIIGPDASVCAGDYKDKQGKSWEMKLQYWCLTPQITFDSSWKKMLSFDSNFMADCSKGFSWQDVSISSGNGLAPYRWQTITWSNVYWDLWCHVTSLGSHKLSNRGYVCSTWIMMMSAGL